MSACFDRKDAAGLTALHKAAKDGNLNVVKLFVALGANISITDNDGKTAFDLAKTHIEVASYLGHKMSEKFQHENKYDDALKMYEELLAIQEDSLGYHHGMTVKTRDCKGSLQSLLYVMGRSNTKPPSLLKDLNTQNAAEGKTPLHEAANNGNLIVVKRLVSLGADVNIVDNDGKTAFDLANSKRDVEVASFLVPIMSKKFLEENKFVEAVEVYDELHQLYLNKLEEVDNQILQNELL